MNINSSQELVLITKKCFFVSVIHLCFCWQRSSRIKYLRMKIPGRSRVQCQISGVFELFALLVLIELGLRLVTSTSTSSLSLGEYLASYIFSSFSVYLFIYSLTTLSTLKRLYKCQQTFSQVCTICSNQWLNPNFMLSGLKDRNSCHKVINISIDKIYYY